MTELLFYIFASLAIGGAIGMVTRSNPVASLLFLVLTFFSLAAIFIILGAHFIGAIQVILYAGAILVLFLFVIMLLNLGHDYQADLRAGAWILLAFVAAGIIGYTLAQLAGGTAALIDRGEELFMAGGLASDTAAVAAPVGSVEAAAATRGTEQVDAVAVVALPLFRQYLVAFELTGVLLLVAIVGAVLLAKRRV